MDNYKDLNDEELERLEKDLSEEIFQVTKEIESRKAGNMQKLWDDTVEAIKAYTSKYGPICLIHKHESWYLDYTDNFDTADKIYIN